MQNNLEPAIDIRPYIQALLSQWVAITVVTVVAAAVAFLFATSRPDVYQASALVTVLQPRQNVQFATTIQDRREAPPVRAYPQLAMSDGVLQALQVAAGPLLADRPLNELRSAASAEIGDELRIVRLSYKAPEAEAAAEVVNLWAELFVVWADEIYGTGGNRELLFFETQLDEAATSLEMAEMAFIAFEEGSRIAIVDNELQSLLAQQTSRLALKQMLTDLIENGTNLQQQLVDGAQTELTLSDQIAALMLQVNALGDGYESGADMGGLPFVLQIDVNQGLTNVDKDEQVALLSGLIGAMAARVVTIEEELSDLEPEILSRQRSLMVMRREEARLQVDLDVAHETYAELTRQVSEARIGVQADNSGVQLASRAAVPVAPIGSNRLINTAVAAFLGFVVSAGGTLVFSWWQKEFGQ